MPVTVRVYDTLVTVDGLEWSVAEPHEGAVATYCQMLTDRLDGLRSPAEPWPDMAAAEHVARELDGEIVRSWGEPEHGPPGTIY